MLQQDVEGRGQEDEERGIQQVRDDPHADEPGVGDYVPSRDRRIARGVHLGIHVSLGETAEDADEQIEEAGDSRYSLW
jgi:hypothetical protein